MEEKPPLLDSYYFFLISFSVASLRSFPGLNAGESLAGTSTFSPVLGFLATLGALSFKRNVPNPLISTFSPLARASVTTSKNGQDAWNKLQQYDFDLLLTDIVMPEMDGFELSFKVRQDERLKYMPIIAISSEDIKKSSDSGIDEFVPKLKLERLTGAIEKALQKRLKKAA